MTDLVEKVEHSFVAFLWFRLGQEAFQLNGVLLCQWQNYLIQSVEHLLVFDVLGAALIRFVDRSFLFHRVY